MSADHGHESHGGHSEGGISTLFGFMKGLFEFPTRAVDSLVGATRGFIDSILCLGFGGGDGGHDDHAHANH